MEIFYILYCFVSFCCFTGAFLDPGWADFLLCLVIGVFWPLFLIAIIILSIVNLFTGDLK